MSFFALLYYYEYFFSFCRVYTSNISMLTNPQAPHVGVDSGVTHRRANSASQAKHQNKQNIKTQKIYSNFLQFPHQMHQMHQTLDSSGLVLLGKPARRRVIGAAVGAGRRSFPAANAMP